MAPQHFQSCVVVIEIPVVHQMFSRSWSERAAAPVMADTTGLLVTKTIGEEAFDDCSSLTSVSINSVTSLEWGAFYNCYNLRDVSMNSVTSIGGDAFRRCMNLVSVTLPASLSSIGSQAFVECTKLVSVNFASSAITASSWGSSPFGAWPGCCVDGSTYYLRSECTSRSSHCAYCPDKLIGALNCTAAVAPALSSSTWVPMCVKNVVVPEGVQSIPTNALKGCKEVVSVTLPRSVTSIGSNAFSSCSNLVNISMNNVTSIGDHAFSSCGNLVDISMNSVTSIGFAAFFSVYIQRFFYFRGCFEIAFWL